VRQAVVPPAKAARQLRHRLRPQRNRRARRPLLRGDGPERRRPSEPETGNAPTRRDPGPSPVDRVQEGHGHHAEAGADNEQLQDHRRARRQRPHRLRRVHHRPVHHQRHHPRPPHSRLQANWQRHGSQLPLPLRVENAR